KQYLAESELQEFHTYYSEAYKLTIRFDRIRNDLVNSGIFSYRDGREFRFKYRYVYYYFVARYLSGAIREEKTHQLIDYMSQRVHREEYANILIFLSYLSKDPVIIQTILNNAKNLFSNCSPCDLDEH